MAYQSPSRQTPADPRISISFDPFPQDETPEPSVPALPLPAIQETGKNPFGDEAETLAKLGGKTAPARNNPFDSESDETPDDSSHGRNPFDETDDESSAGNPFDKETPAKNPFNNTTSATNPFDAPSSDETDDETPANNPFSETPAKNPFDETPSNNPFDKPSPKNPFDETDDETDNETPAKNPFDETPIDAAPSNPFNETPANTLPESRDALVEQQETAQLQAIQRSFAANEDGRIG